MLSAYEKDKIREGVHRIRQEVPEATEDQMYRMFLYAVAKTTGKSFNQDELSEIRTLIADHVKEFNKALN